MKFPRANEAAGYYIFDENFLAQICLWCEMHGKYAPEFSEDIETILLAIEDLCNDDGSLKRQALEIQTGHPKGNPFVEGEEEER